MDKKFFGPIRLVAIISLAIILLNWRPAQAQTDTITINYPLEPYNRIDVSLGRAGIYLPSSNYQGTLILSRINPFPTENLTFTQRWIDIQIYDSDWREIKTANGYVFVYFNLDQNSREAWDQGLLRIYHYNSNKESWKECKTRFVADKNVPYGRVRTLILKDFGLYGLAMKNE